MGCIGRHPLVSYISSPSETLGPTLYLQEPRGLDRQMAEQGREMNEGEGEGRELGLLPPKSGQLAPAGLVVLVRTYPGAWLCPEDQGPDYTCPFIGTFHLAESQGGP